MQKKYSMLENVLNEELILYRDIENLYHEKKDILVNHKNNLLPDIDSKILKNLDSIKEKIKNRQDVLNSLFGKVITLTEVIDSVKGFDKGLSDKFKQLQVEINEQIRVLKKLDRVNNVLIQHGLLLTNKTMQMLLNSVHVSSNEYDKKGKAVESSDMDGISSIIEEV